MAKTKQEEIIQEVREILKRAAVAYPTSGGTEDRRSYLTVYQILDRLTVRDKLISEYGEPGRDGGNPYTAANFVSQAAAKVPGVDTKLLDTGGLILTVKSKQLEGGTTVCTVFGLPND